MGLVRSTLKSSGKCFIYGIRIKFHKGFSKGTHYMKNSLLDTRRVISSIITRNFFVTRNKRPKTIGTNGMCISRDDNCVNTMSFPRQLPTTARKLFTTILFRFVAFFDVCNTSCPVGKLPFGFLLCDEFLKTYFLSMCQSSRMKGFERCFKVEDQGQWRI